MWQWLIWGLSPQFGRLQNGRECLGTYIAHISVEKNHRCCARSIPKLFLRKADSLRTGEKALLVLCTLRRWWLLSGHQSRQKQAILPSLWDRWRLEGLKAVKALLMLGILKFEISEPPCWTPEDLSQCALGAYSSVQKERSWLEGWKCAHRHFLLFSFHLGELQTLGNEGITGQTALCGTCHLARHWASPHRHRHMRIIEAGSSPDRELENRGTASLLSSTGEIQGWSKLV